MKWVIDRFEGETAVLENIKTMENLDFPRSELPDGIKEGDVLSQVDGVWSREIAETNDRASSIRARFDRMKKGK